MSLDWKKPLRFKDAPDYLTLKVIDHAYIVNELGAVLLLKVSQPNHADVLILRHQTGAPLTPNDAYGDLIIENAPVVESGFYPINNGSPSSARGLISLSLALDEYPSHKYFIEVVRQDGKPKEVRLHVRT